VWDGDRMRQCVPCRIRHAFVPSPAFHLEISNIGTAPTAHIANLNLFLNMSIAEEERRTQTPTAQYSRGSASHRIASHRIASQNAHIPYLLPYS